MIKKPGEMTLDRFDYLMRQYIDFKLTDFDDQLEFMAEFEFYLPGVQTEWAHASFIRNMKISESKGKTMKFDQVIGAFMEGKKIQNGAFSFQRKKDPKTGELTDALKVDGSLFGANNLINKFFADGWEISDPK